MPGRLRPGDLVADRYLIADLLDESRNGRFWRAEDQVLQRHVAVHVIPADDDRSHGLLDAARRSAAVHDPRILRVLDADRRGDLCFVVNEWGSGSSLDVILSRDGAIPARRAAWIVGEVAAALALCHERDFAHGRLAPENVLVDHAGQVRVIGTAVEAALWGLPPGRISGDVTDLAGLLYAALTGRWAGVSRSQVPPAHQVGGRVLRPRKVRAGVPRVLDGLCDEVLNGSTHGSHARSPYDLTTARGIAEALHDFVGDPQGLVVPERAAIPMLPVPALPDGDPPARWEGPDDAARSKTRPEAQPEPQPSTAVEPSLPGPDAGDLPPAVREDTVLRTRAALDDEATVAGLPVFDDVGEVDWVSTGSLSAPVTVPPPPPPDEPAPRPLFAPTPAAGEPARRPRPGVTTTDHYWPWDGTGPGSQTGSQTGSRAGSQTGSQTGSHGGTGSWLGVTGTGTGAVILEEDEDDEVPGRSWLRLAAVVGAVTLLMLAVVFTFNLVQGRAPLEFDDEPDPTRTPSASASATQRSVVQLTDLTADDLDPQSDDGLESPELVGAVVDGDPETNWRTSTYLDQLGPPLGLKTGVGVVLDLGSVADVTRIRVDLVGSPTSVTLYGSESPVTRVAGLDPLATQTVQARLDAPLKVRARYVVVWLTSLPPVEGGFQGRIAEVAVWGSPLAPDAASGTAR